MAIEVTWGPGAVVSPGNIDLPVNSPPIGSVVSARDDSLTEGTPNTFTETTPTPTKVDEDTIQLDADTTAETLLTLVYEPVGAMVSP